MCTAFRFVAILIASQFIWFNSLYAQRIEFERVATPSNQVHVVAQDSVGFMWFGGVGLHRYDGYDYISYYHDAADSSTLSSNNITNVLVDSQGDLWVGTGGSSWLLNLFDPVTDAFKRFSPGDVTHDVDTRSVICMHEDRGGMIWISTTSGELYEFDRDAQSFKMYTIPGEDRLVQSMVERHDGSLWVGVSASPSSDEAGGLYVVDKYNGELHEIQGWYDPSLRKPKEITALFEDKSTNLWLGTWPNGLIQYGSNLRVDTAVTYVPATRLNDIQEDDEGRLWLAYTWSGLRVFNPADGSFFSHENELRFTRVDGEHAYMLFVDRQDTWWVTYLGDATASGELFKINRPPNFITYTPDPDREGSLSPHRQVYSFYEKNDSTVWLGMADSRVNSFNPQSGATKPEVAELKDANTRAVMTFLERRNGELWLGGFGVFRYQQLEDSLALLPFRGDTLIKSLVIDFLEDSAGDIWIGTYQKGLFQFNQDLELVSHFTGAPQSEGDLLGDIVFSIIEDTHGGIWVSSYTSNRVNFFGALHRFDRGSNTFERYDAFYGAVPHEDRNGGYWLTTATRGVYRWHPEHGIQQHYSLGDGLPHATVYCLIEDSRGVLWLSTRMGLASLNPETGVIRTHFSEDDLLDASMSEGANSCYRSTDGTVYIGREPGFTVFKPDEFDFNKIPPKVALVNIQVAGDSSGYSFIDGDGTRTIELTHTQNDLAISFVGLHYEEPIENTYAYKLDGFNEEWVRTGNERIARFFQLTTRCIHIYCQSGQSQRGLE